MLSLKQWIHNYFIGMTDPLEAKNLIVEIEKAFRVYRCTEEEKVNYASYLLLHMSGGCKKSADVGLQWWLLGKCARKLSMKNIFLIILEYK